MLFKCIPDFECLGLPACFRMISLSLSPVVVAACMSQPATTFGQIRIFVLFTAAPSDGAEVSQGLVNEWIGAAPMLMQTLW